jgi:hypothetical protein
MDDNTWRNQEQRACDRYLKYEINTLDSNLFNNNTFKKNPSIVVPCLFKSNAVCKKSIKELIFLSKNRY